MDVMVMMSAREGNKASTRDRERVAREKPHRT